FASAANAAAGTPKRRIRPANRLRFMTAFPFGTPAGNSACNRWDERRSHAFKWAPGTPTLSVGPAEIFRNALARWRSANRLPGSSAQRRCLRALADYRLLHRVLFGCFLRCLLLLLARGGLGRVRLGKKYLLTVGRRLHLLLLVIASKRCRGNGEAKRD